MTILDSLLARGPTDLHVHLDGAMRPGTVVELATDLGLTVPDLPFYQGIPLAMALDRFGFILQLLQTPTALSRAAKELEEDMIADEVEYFETRFAPHLHTQDGMNTQDAALAVAHALSHKHSNVILCGLYGDHPDVFHELVDVAKAFPWFVGIDLAGGPAPHHEYGLADYRDAFRRAKNHGVKTTAHVGEGLADDRPPIEIHYAVEELLVDRVGHATTLMTNQQAVQALIDRGVTVEACVTSNVLTGIVGSAEDHPFRQMLEAGLRVAPCSDDPFFMGNSTRSEYKLVHRLMGGGDLADHAVSVMMDFARAARFR